MVIKEYNNWKNQAILYWTNIVSGTTNESDLITQISNDILNIDTAYNQYITFLNTTLKSIIENSIFTFFIYTILNDIVKIKEVDMSGVDIPDFKQKLNYYIKELPSTDTLYNYTSEPDLTDPTKFVGTLTKNNFESIINDISQFNTSDTNSINTIKSTAQAKITLRTSYHVSKYNNKEPMPKIENSSDDVLKSARELLSVKLNVSQLEQDLGWNVNKLYLNKIQMLP